MSKSRKIKLWSNSTSESHSSNNFFKIFDPIKHDIVLLFTALLYSFLNYVFHRILFTCQFSVLYLLKKAIKRKRVP